MPGSTLSGVANLLVLPNLDSANIAFNLVKAAADGLPVGPLLLGMSKPAHVLVPSVTARGDRDMTALAVVEGGMREGKAFFLNKRSKNFCLLGGSYYRVSLARLVHGPVCSTAISYHSTGVWPPHHRQIFEVRAKFVPALAKAFAHASQF